MLQTQVKLERDNFDESGLIQIEGVLADSLIEIVEICNNTDFETPELSYMKKFIKYEYETHSDTCLNCSHSPIPVERIVINLKQATQVFAQSTIRSMPYLPQLITFTFALVDIWGSANDIVVEKYECCGIWHFCI
ncbi:hypothetical protein [Rummeliibacillus pycnus]|uniref:hypothetical protein n=1 Tax=Rummeliibacillus pycnus TaxID=101070 RepID=UPI003D2BB69A